jgi:cellulose synthase/poly-beta-1,6-N-acetylglucosamine synthase-like glycosyltransferase
MTRSESAAINQTVAEFAWRIKNWVRPLGLLSLNMPCQLMGTGMAFPWSVIWSANLASGEVVEDLRLGLELGAVGKVALFCPDARVTSSFPLSSEAASGQRERWEGGQLRMIVKDGPKLFIIALARRNLELLALVLDLLVPPLTVLTTFLLLNLFGTVVAFFTLSMATPFSIGIFNVFAFSATLLMAWNKFGRDVLTSDRLCLLAKYGVQKIGIYTRMYSRKGSPRWVRTERDGSKKSGRDSN